MAKKFEKGHEYHPPSPEVVRAKRELRALIGDALVDHHKDFLDAWDVLKVKNPKAYCDIYISLLKFKLPQVSSIAFESEEKENPAIELLRQMAQYKR